MGQVGTERAIRSLVESNVRNFAQTFSQRHIADFDNPDGTINMKIHNVFISVLGEELKYYNALVRSFDSSLGNMLETLALGIARLSYVVKTEISGPLYREQIIKIAELLEAYKNRNNQKVVDANDYLLLNNLPHKKDIETRTHVSDYYLYDEINNDHFLIELKIGGDLDTKKARSEKEALFEQYCILSNTLGKNANIKCYFATAYNRYGEGKPWTQGRVLQFFSQKELLIGRDFWNFVCKDNKGYDIVIDEYTKNSHYIKDALEDIKSTYLD